MLDVAFGIEYGKAVQVCVSGGIVMIYTYIWQGSCEDVAIDLTRSSTSKTFNLSLSPASFSHYHYLHQRSWPDCQAVPLIVRQGALGPLLVSFERRIIVTLLPIVSTSPCR